jgi:hypothetical protein
MMKLVNDYIDQHQLVEAMESEDYPCDKEVEHLIRIGNELGELIALDSQERELRKSEEVLYGN